MQWNCVCLVLLVTFQKRLAADLGRDLTAENLKYLQDKGYLSPPNPHSGALKTQEDVRKSLRLFQEFAGIPVTGKLDDQTILKFHQPRCGMKDILHKDGRSKRYVLQGDKWEKKELSYRIINYSADLSRNDIHRAIRKALSRWQAASQLHFYEKRTGEADIMIKFTRKSHSDPYPFDGPGGTLAHAFYPGRHRLAGDTHFDDDEVFTLRSRKGKNFYWVALHEFGHAVGLEHSRDKGTIMYPFYEGYNGEDVDLSFDDKQGVQALYGRPHESRRPGDTPKRNSKVCLNRVKTVFNSNSDETVVINEDKVYVYDKLLELKKGPVFISDYYRGLHGVDATYKLANGRTVFLQGNMYWEYWGQRHVRGPEHVARIGFKSDMYYLNAAFRWSRNGRVYLFKGDKYWRYDSRRYRVDPGYPKLIKNAWIGVPNNLNSVFQWRNRKIYFFKGQSYYRFSDRTFQVHKRYPLPIKNNFLICDRVSLSRLVAYDEPAKDSASMLFTPNCWTMLVLLVVFQF